MVGELIGLLVGFFQFVVIVWLFDDPLTLTKEDLVLEFLPREPTGK